MASSRYVTRNDHEEGTLDQDFSIIFELYDISRLLLLQLKCRTSKMKHLLLPKGCKSIVAVV